MPSVITQGEEFSITSERDIVRARQCARDLSKTMHFSLIDQSRIATAVSELTRNVLTHATASTGNIAIRPVSNGVAEGIEVVVTDQGPGIPDIERALQSGYSSGRGMGLGLPGAKRLMDEMDIRSAPGSGTSVTIRKWQR